jgi:hypothetical protein
VSFEFSQKIEAIVKRTAQHGLDQAATSPQMLEKWLLIWSADVAGELGEVYATEEEDIVEVGDVLWGMTAVALLLEIPVRRLFEDSDSDKILPVFEDAFDAILASLRLLEIAKKVCRDGQEARPIDKVAIELILRSIVQYLDDNYSLVDAAIAVDLKLQERYPDGFSPAASVGRAV